jgi:hypothetical protein
MLQVEDFPVLNIQYSLFPKAKTVLVFPVYTIKLLVFYVVIKYAYTLYSETSIHRFRWGSEKETMDPGKQ